MNPISLKTDEHENQASSKSINPELWVEQYGEILFRVAIRKLADPATAEDLVQDTLLSALEGYHCFEGKASFQTWLLGILKRKIADHYRHQQVVGRMLGKGGSNVPDEKILGQQSHDEPHAQEFNSKGDWNTIPKIWKNRHGDFQSKKPDDLAQDLEFWSVVDNCTSEMPEHLSRAFKQRALVGNKPATICEREGISQKNLSVRLHRARLLIRRCLEIHWFGD